MNESLGLRALIGRELSSVEFVRDYVQLRFDGPCLSAIIKLVVRRGEVSIVPGTVGYADALVGLIGDEVQSALALAGDVLRVVIQGGTSIEVSLRPEDYRLGPEAVILRNAPDEVWVW